MNEPSVQYGQADTSFRAAGGEDGIRQLVDRFYARMGSDKRFERIFRLHPAAIDTSVDKLARFLNGWLG
ncbi:MAG: globin, partial [Verrucomicrobia bacterium]|nr:globin [Verrucomicrobiota bacterium]